MTLYTLVNILKSVALSQPNVRMATDGSIYDKLNATNSVKYDVVHFSQTKHIEDEETDTYGFNIFYVSRLEDSLEDNRLQIQSIGKEVLGNILRSFCENWSIDFPEIIYYPFTQKFADLCAGVYCRVEIEVPKEIVCADDYIDEITPSKGIKLENIKVEIDQNGTREVTPSPGFDGIGKVTIVTNVTGGSCDLEYKEVEYTENGDYTILPSSGYDGLSEVAVSVDVPSRYDEGYDDGYEDGEAAQKAKLTVTSFTTNDTYVNANGWSSVTVNVDTGIGYHTVVFDFSESVRPEGLINKAAITITSTYGSTSYTYSGNNITTLLLPGVDYIITYSEVEGYQHPNSMVLTTVWDGSSVIDVIYSDISYLTVSPSSVTFYENVSAKTITVSSLVGNWTATTNDNWYGLSQYTGGTGETTITITANTQNTARTGTVTFTDGTNTAELTVKENYFIGKPLTFNIISSGTIYWVLYPDAYTTGSRKTIQYKINDGDWTTITSNEWPVAPSIPVNSGDIVLLRGDNVKYSVAGPEGYYNHFISSDAMFEVEGNIMSLIDSQNFATATTLAEYYNFYGLFINCTGLTSAENLVLPATTLASWCYGAMFYGCTNLTTAPVLPATTLTDRCYYGMFASCTSLTAAPELPATTLARSCYQEMFSGCTSLTSAPVLPATALARSCYGDMFYGCTSLTTAPALPATTLADYCYYYMFQGCTRLTSAPSTLPAPALTEYCYYGMFSNCTSLTEAPELPATTLAKYCCQYMFADCTSLTSAPVLPATTLAEYCYYYMFQGCTSLTEAPELPATTLAYYCYGYMFSGCTSLTTAPSILPATTLANNCYWGMFSDCTSLTSAPVLPATTLAKSCYEYMFQGCANLNYIKCLATNVPYTFRGTTYLWVDGVAATGTFVKNANMSSWETGTDGIPTGWTVVNNS